MSTIRIEAEEMTLDGYRLESNGIASGGQEISLLGGELEETGTASFEFSGTEGYYQVVVGYIDETDGVSQLTLTHPSGTTNWQLDQELGSAGPVESTQVSKTVATKLLVKSGDMFEISGSENGGEYARVDYIEFIPVGNIFTNTKGNETFEGSSGNDTVDYSQADNGIVADLNEGMVLAPIYGTMEQPKILIVGDSITDGEIRVNSIPGAYRTQLWNNFVADGLNVDFVGSRSNGPASLDDKDHEGHPGWEIDEISNLVDDGLLTDYQSDVVLLMIGTNDVLHGSSAQTAANDLSQLIDQITEELPNAHLLVSSIPPLKPWIKGQKRADEAEAFNALIPGLVDQKAAQGQQVTYVNAGGSLTLSDISSDGIHPNATGYDNLGNAWYDALVERDTLISIENIKGTTFDDKLTGNDENNILTGSDGSDTLAGGAGADRFTYENPNQGSDLIADFSLDDQFVISASGFGSGLVAGVGLSETDSSTGVFVSSPTPTSLGNNANFLYDTNTGVLSFDRDGIGATEASTIATLSDAPSLSSAQFTIVS